MSRYNKPQERTWKNYLVQALVVAAAIFVIVWFLPRGDRSTMRFDVGRPWPYGRFIAPYDFPIFKTAEQLQQERDSIHAFYEPYFELRQDVVTRQITAFRAAFRERYAALLSHQYRTYVEGRLREIYERGIVDANDLQVLQLAGTQAVSVYHGTEAVTTPITQLYTEKSAYEQLLDVPDENVLSKAKLKQMDLNEFVTPNLVYDESRSQAAWEEMEKSLSPSSGVVLAGQNIIDRGDIVDEQVAQILDSYSRAQASRQQSTKADHLSILGQVLYVAVVLLCLAFYFNLFRQDYINNSRSVLLLLALVLSFPLLTSALVRHTWLSVYIIPYAMLPIFIRVFMDSRTAFFTHTVMVLLCAISLRYPYEFVATQLIAGLVAIYSLRDLSERSQIFRTAFLVTGSILVTFMSIDLIHGRMLFADDTMTSADVSMYTHMLISGVLLLFAYPLMYLLERIFGFTSNVTLVELSNVNRDLLRELSQTAPGTFQHSMMVSNLAAEVANKIGAKAQLVRTGALYHDIGKMKNPEYFTENQLGGVNPHNFLTCKESAAIILRHVTDGLELADRHRLPRSIRDFIATHHGRGVAKYFYITQKNEHPDEEIDIADYTYIGPNPSTTEQAILMMVDAVEASARSLKEYTEESIGALVEKIIDGQMADGFFRDCPITFADIQSTKTVLKEKLKTIYHTRVSYPTLKTEPEALEAASSTEEAAPVLDVKKEEL
ncbi:MAG: HDIG domain-containing protein [Bacteroidaceae bacterium]|nr:HDIG domain-containing protein [Bacteroidaceae bacterium]